MLYIEKDIISHGKYRFNPPVHFMPICLPSMPISDIIDQRDRPGCFTTRMPGDLKSEKTVSLYVFSKDECSKNKDESLDEYDICAGFPDDNGDYQSYQDQINYGAALICYKSNDDKTLILTGIASRKDLSPRNNKPGVFTNIYKIKSEIQKQLSEFEFFQH